ncbi:MAG: GNAT family N-acetyltransferase [Thiolinea sp.]
MTTTASLLIQPLSKSHLRKNFDCTEAELNRYLQQTALQHQQKLISRTWVAVNPAEPAIILGFYTTTLAEVPPQNFNNNDAKRLPKNPLPVVRLSRLATDRQHQSKQIGQRLLIDAITKTARLLEEFSIVAMVVDAKNQSAAGYYQHFGFIPLQDDPLKLYLPAQTLLEVNESLS